MDRPLGPPFSPLSLPFPRYFSPNREPVHRLGSRCTWSVNTVNLCMRVNCTTTRNLLFSEFIRRLFSSSETVFPRNETLSYRSDFLHRHVKSSSFYCRTKTRKSRHIFPRSFQLNTTFLRTRIRIESKVLIHLFRILKISLYLYRIVKKRNYFKLWKFRKVSL